MKSSRLFTLSCSLVLALPTLAREPPKPASRPPGPSPGMGMQGPRLTAEQEIKEYLTLDKNGDGNLSKEEITIRFQTLITRADSNGDGMVSSEELVQMVNRRFAAKAKHGGESGPAAPPGGIPSF